MPSRLIGQNTRDHSQFRDANMQLTAEKLGKSDKLDRLRYLRADGSSTSSSMPRQGILPHDLVHYVVESALPLQHGFMSQVAAGADAAFVMQAAHDPANTRIAVEAVQVEAVVEALQAQLWNGGFDSESFNEGVLGACIARAMPAPNLEGLDAEKALFERALALNQQWSELGYFQSITLVFKQQPKA